MTFWQEIITLTPPIHRGVWNMPHKFHLYLIQIPNVLKWFPLNFQNYPPPEDPGVRGRLNECLETILNKAQEPPKSKKVQHSNAKNSVLFEAISLIIHNDRSVTLRDVFYGGYILGIQVQENMGPLRVMLWFSCYGRFCNMGLRFAKFFVFTITVFHWKIVNRGLKKQSYNFSPTFFQYFLVGSFDGLYSLINAIQIQSQVSQIIGLLQAPGCTCMSWE